ncbi:Uncharacterized protein HZ326_19368 [Fusarium oxysporum f. sp. albedinis]|nr:Uncharacterized protein HZ326_19368 [Fusarium oxysporum f. sp. albedinis]
MECDLFFRWSRIVSVGWQRPRRQYEGFDWHWTFRAPYPPTTFKPTNTDEEGNRSWFHDELGMSPFLI